MSVPDITAIPKHALINLGLQMASDICHQSSPEDLVEPTLQPGQGVSNDTGGLVVNTRQFTGRSPKDSFIVKDNIIANSVNWNDFNMPSTPNILTSCMQI